jgi:hypothetical protein
VPGNDDLRAGTERCSDEAPFQQAAELIEGLRSHTINHDVIMIPNEIHDMACYSSWMLLFNAADVYFDRHLNKPSVPAPVSCLPKRRRVEIQQNRAASVR